MSYSAANAPCFSGRESCHLHACINSLRQGGEIVLSSRQRWRNNRLQQGSAGAGGLLSVGDIGGDRDPLPSQSRDSLRNGSSTGKSKDTIKAAAIKLRWPFDRGNSTHQSHKEEGLPVSLFAPYKDLPTDGRTRTEEEETCDPMERSCQVPMHVWESKCRACYGSGTVTSYGRRGKRSSGICPSCTGIGYVRRTSSRLIPDLNGDGKHMTIGRPLSDEDYDEFVNSRRNGSTEKASD